MKKTASVNKFIKHSNSTFDLIDAGAELVRKHKENEGEMCALNRIFGAYIQMWLDLPAKTRELTFKTYLAVDNYGEAVAHKEIERFDELRTKALDTYREFVFSFC